MRIENRHELDQGVALFFFAHQDDEFGVFQQIYLACQAGQRVSCAYLTSGVLDGNSSSVRDEESIEVLTRLGVARKDIFFVGAELNIPDGQLLRSLERAVDWIEQWIPSFDLIKSIYLPAWEGGHHDHDALHAAVLIATLGSTPHLLLRQFPLYNAHRCRNPFFRVLKPLSSNGIINSIQIPLKNRIRFLRYCLSYPSQYKSWIGLFPFTLLHYLFYGVESVQDVSLKRLRERPHEGSLYYERRRFCTWLEVSEAIDRCLKRKSLRLPQ